MIKIPKLVNTASQSTNQYLKLLTQAGKGEERHLVSSITPSPKSLALIGNQTWVVVDCELPKNESFPPDAGAAFVPTNHPGTRIGAQILAYDRRSGRAELALVEMPPDQIGELVIDFKWLIERCLTWLKKNGSHISNPFLSQSHLSIQVRPESSKAILSEEQIQAVKSLLANPVGYVWGPPGTGKTRHVLAETVAHLIRAGKRVLVTAPTNLAVDNALDAILRLACVPNIQILRTGIPSPEFSHDWPECCEERALRGKLSGLEASELLLVKLIGSRQRIGELNRLIPEHEKIAASLSKTAQELNEACQRMNEGIGNAEAALSAANEDCHKTEKEIQNRKAAHLSLKIDELRKGVAALEIDQMNLVVERQFIEKQIANLGWMTRIFTKKRVDLTRRKHVVDGRISEVERTLTSQRLRAVELEAVGARLDSEIEALGTRLRAFIANKQESTLIRNRLSSENQLLIDKQSHANAEADLACEILDQFQKEHVELMALGELPDDSAIAYLSRELVQIRNKMAKITQDLSQKLVLGMTLEGFIGLSMGQALHFDHIVVDEAGYAPLAKVLPLLIQDCPISLLGDHRQLPPIYEGKNDVLSESYWGVSALYLEEAFQAGVGDDPQKMVIAAKRDPKFQQLCRSKLTKSYRFGPELADLLDRHFYQIGLQSHSTIGTNIRLRNCRQSNAFAISDQDKWQNTAEAEAVSKATKNWVEWHIPDKGGLAILTPYKNQVRLIRESLKRLRKSGETREWGIREWEDFGRVEVLTVHRSQGREWNTVFFSATDTAMNGPFLADTAEPKGRQVVNTAISRSKKYLRFFFDCQFWQGRTTPNLLTEITVVP